MNGKLNAFKTGSKSGLGANDLIQVSITGSRGGTGALRISTYFNSEGVEVDLNLMPVKNAVPLDTSAIAGPGGGAAPPPFPQAAYQAALAEDVSKAEEILQAHQKALTQFKAGGKATVEDGVIDAVLRYCYDELQFSPTDVSDKFVITRKDVVLSKEQRVIAGLSRTVYEVRLASKFGAE